uniref:AMP-dependent synthetase/ligase domain-containing protein n=1 Tax=Salix viminalis TaxID=40686 RepID=A0A6N2ML44_SALVM
MEELMPMPPSSCPLTPLGFLERAATVYGDCPSIIYNNTTYTWSQTHRRCLKVASSLSSNGIRPGHVVSVVAPNVPAMYELQFAVPMSGAILNNINTRLDARTISIILRHGESKLVFVDYLSLDVIREALSLFPPETPCPTLVLITDDEEEAPPPSLSGDPEFNWVQPQSEWDPVVLNYTSGTTSDPKGVVQSHRATFIMTIGSLIDWSLPNQAVYLWALPIFHVNGWSYPWGLAAVGGTSICLRRVEAPTIYSLIKRHGVTHMCGAPVVLNMLTNSPMAERLRNPVQILTAGAPPPSTVLSRAESLGFVTKVKTRSSDRCFTEMDVVDRIQERVWREMGGSVMLGYFKDPSGTSKCMKDGWFYTGDVGVIHSDGYLEVKDRSKDVIISGGENISSVEIESVLYTHPAVNEAAVVARPDEFWGESPCAFVSLKHGLSNKPGERDIIDYCREKMARFMVPKTVVFKDELPKTSTGKIQKYFLREYAKELDSSKVKMATGKVGSCFYPPLYSPRLLQTPFISTPISTSICISMNSFNQSTYFAKKRGSEMISIFQKNQATVLHQPRHLCNTLARFL